MDKAIREEGTEERLASIHAAVNILLPSIFYLPRLGTLTSEPKASGPAVQFFPAVTNDFLFLELWRWDKGTEDKTRKVPTN